MVTILVGDVEARVLLLKDAAIQLLAGGGCLYGPAGLHRVSKEYSPKGTSRFMPIVTGNIKQT